LCGGEADKLEDDESTTCVDHAAGLAERVVEDLGNGLSHGRGENVGGLAHAKAEDDGEEPPGDVGKQHGH
jgi:hypothetical protein